MKPDHKAGRRYGPRRFNPSVGILVYEAHTVGTAAEVVVGFQSLGRDSGL